VKTATDILSLVTANPRSFLASPPAAQDAHQVLDRAFPQNNKPQTLPTQTKQFLTARIFSALLELISVIFIHLHCRNLPLCHATQDLAGPSP
jgi:hypothetical protein